MSDYEPQDYDTRLRDFYRDGGVLRRDYRRTFVILTGNLDELYRDLAWEVTDADTDADLFSRRTRDLNFGLVRRSLLQLFRPEQIARLGIVAAYPSLDRSSYERFIDRELHRLTSSVGASYDRSLRDLIYSEGVFPAQGTRATSSLLNLLMPPVLLACVGHENPSITIVDGSAHIGSSVVPLQMPVRELRSLSSLRDRTILAVHEAGHALLHTILQGAPDQVSINRVQGGGQVSSRAIRIQSKIDLENEMCILLGGQAAEALVFGAENITTGSSTDMREATHLAAHAMRTLSFNQFNAVIDGEDILAVQGTEESDRAIESLVTAQGARARSYLEISKRFIILIADELLRNSTLDRAWILNLGIQEDPATDFVARYEAFRVSEIR